MKIAVLDDYIGVSQKLADWSALTKRADITVFDRNLVVPDEAARVLEPFDILCLLRERMAVPRNLIERLPNLKLMTVTGAVHRTLDLQAATEHGIAVSNAPSDPAIHLGTPELTWGLLLASVRHIPAANDRMRAGGWQDSYGMRLSGKTLGVIGLGRIGKTVARYGQAFGMKVVAWSQNLTHEAASAVGVQRVEKDELLARSDVISIHVVLSQRSRGLIGARELALMKPTAHLINTARGPIVDQAALVDCLRAGKIGGAALDVYDQEPLPPDHPLRGLDNLIMTPHLGYMVEDSLRVFYGDMVDAVTAFLDGKPIRVMNPETLNPGA